jgi:hypothetical protein
MPSRAAVEAPCSAIYEGWVRHRRLDPVEHAFRYPIFMVYLDLDELPQALDPLRGWSARRPALAWFKRSDHLGPADAPLDQAVRDRVAAETGQRPAGPVRMLTNLRYFGHCFNPVTFFFCFDESGVAVESVLAEVNNTPWGESHAYVIGTDPSASNRVVSGQLQKEFHVSPLMGMDHVYEWRTTVPDEDLQVHIASHQDGVLAFDATLSLERRELAPTVARRMLIRYPAMTAQVVAKIYWQALRLRLKGAPWHPHPERS